MDILQLIKDGLALIQELQPGLEATVKAGATLGTMGSAAVKVIQKGKQLTTYVITSRKKEVKGAEAAPSTSGLTPIPADESLVEKADVAIVVDVSRRTLRDVGRYLAEHEIDADVIVLTNDPAYGDVPKFLDPEDAETWVELVQEFNVVTSRVKTDVGAARMHVFLGTPLSLAFGLGTVWGTVDNAMVYHWENNTYHPTMPISRKLRGA